MLGGARPLEGEGGERSMANSDRTLKGGGLDEDMPPNSGSEKNSRIGDLA